LTPTRFLQWGRIDQYLELRTKPCFPVWVWCWRPGAAEILPLVTTGRRSYHWRNRTININKLQVVSSTGQGALQSCIYLKKMCELKVSMLLQAEASLRENSSLRTQSSFCTNQRNFRTCSVETMVTSLVSEWWFRLGFFRNDRNWSGEEELWLCD